jgi:hypothetical protein
MRRRSGRNAAAASRCAGTAARSGPGSGARRIALATSRAGAVTTISGPPSWAARYSRKSASVRGITVGGTPNTRATTPISR